METQTFLGMPPPHIVKWIQDHRKQTRVEFVDGTKGDYLIEGTMDCPALIAAGLMPEGSGTESEPSWNNQPVKVKIGSAATGIGDWAFYECRELTSATIPNSVTSIGQDAFCYCNGLTSITIPASVTSIGYQAFDSCSGLASVAIPDSVTSIGMYAFSFCDGLTSVTIGDGVTGIGEHAFYGCSKLESVVIPDSVTSIERLAFSNCSGLTSVTIVANSGNAENVKQAMIAAGVSENITWNMPESATE